MRTVLILLALALAAAPAPAHPGPLLVILLPGTSLRDWRSADAPHLHRLVAAGALAVMNTRTARLPNDRQRESQESAALTLGAGARAAGEHTSENSLPATAPVPGLGLTAATIYARRMGRPPPPEAEVNILWPALLKANTGRGYDLRLGNLADALAAGGIRIRAGGPLASLVAASGDGTVTPASSLKAGTGECVVWDAGDDLPAADPVLERAMTQTATSQGRLIVLSPYAGDVDYKQGRRLTPILEWGSDVPAGLLRSPSTHRLGLVTNTDFAPTVAAYFGATDFPAVPFGRPWAVVPIVGSIRQVSALEEQSYRQAQGMRLLPYLALLLTLWIGTGTALAAAGRLPPLWPLLPPALLLAVLWSTSAASAVLIAPASVLAAGLVLRITGARRTLLAILASLAATMILDMMTGGRLMQESLLGYSAVEGARYYGIGNEAMGALVASLLVLAARLWGGARLVRLALTVLLLTVAALLGSPWAGAKAGGLLVSLAAFGSLLFSLWGGRWSPRIGLGMAVSVALTMAAVAAADAFWPSDVHSHVGEAVHRIQAGGIGEAEDVIVRKLAVEGRLAYHSAWALLLWGGLACWLRVWHRNRSSSKKTCTLFAPGIVAVAACLFLNDAGVVAADLCLVVLWSASLGGSANEKPSEALPLPRADRSQAI